ncbi:MAG: hydroxymethylbilane synthase [Oscillospiraceae bacterium]|nr:hydroxymethylbilane synthase [Oscillospiraceae bacterium]
MKIRIGTRKSRLALAQTEMVVRALKSSRPDIETEIVEISSKGDRITDRPISQISGKGVFSSELEEHILSGDIDAAVHSAKDLDIDLPDGLEISAVLKRGDHRDVLVLPKGAELAPTDKLLIGTGSIRRRENIKRFCPNAVFKDIRGNVETRLNKLISGEYDGIVLAAAGLERLGILSEKIGNSIIENSDLSFMIFEAEEFVPAACQGIIAAETKKDSAASEILREISDRHTYISFETEREFLRICGGDCHTPAGIFTRVSGENIKIICSADGRAILTAEGNVSDKYELLKGLTAKK